MQRSSIRLLNDGFYKMDGGVVFGHMPKTEWETKVQVDRRNRLTMCLNCLLLQTADKNILVDTGAGSKEMNGRRETYGLQPSRLVKGLKDISLTPRDIDAVILSHLHFDHAGGCTRMDRAGTLVTTFPKAKYYVQKTAWEEANSGDEWTRDIYDPADFEPIEDNDQLVLLEGDTEVFPGVWCLVTDGHTKGHQIVRFNHAGERIACMGDLVPTSHHLALTCISSLDRAPERTLAKKRELEDLAEREGWLLVFYHGYECRAGYLERLNGERHLRLTEL
jgi:glyoxylase-like metal-dependent hydrolase (beta-lactamase superfamily II)